MLGYSLLTQVQTEVKTFLTVLAGTGVFCLLLFSQNNKEKGSGVDGDVIRNISSVEYV